MHTIKGNPVLYLVLLFISFTMIVFLVFYSNLSIEFDDFLSPAGFFFILFPVLLIMVSLYVRSFRIIIYDDRLRYKKFRMKEKEILFSEINKLEIKNYFSHGYKFPKKNGLYLNLYVKDKVVMIYAGFARKNLTLLVKTISDKNPSAKMNKFAKKKKNGNFEGITVNSFSQFLNSGFIEMSLRK